MKEGCENKILSRETRQSKCTVPIKIPCPDPKQIKENPNEHCVLNLA